MHHIHTLRAVTPTTDRNPSLTSTTTPNTGLVVRPRGAAL